ncbi:hypothetical protein [Cytobacillus oceanisediminis]|uniref:hypothetical protein n=1 Tax=Cytobacillus oceanisediminis TaxID=665099 RepID=UPI000D711317|nr:hypothetical protein [Cytobacillus oceanisediminis]
MDLIAINVLMYVATGSSAWLRPWCSGFGGVLSSLFSGVNADRFDRRKIMIWTDGISGCHNPQINPLSK